MRRRDRYFTASLAKRTTEPKPTIHMRSDGMLKNCHQVGSETERLAPAVNASTDGMTLNIGWSAAGVSAKMEPILMKGITSDKSEYPSK